MELRTNTLWIRKLAQAENPTPGEFEGNYLICQTDVLDSVREQELISQGFRFLDRMFFFEIPINQRGAEEKNRNNITVSDIEFTCDTQIDDQVYDLACRAYTTDRRFHLDPVFDQGKANQVLRAYIEDYQRRQLKIYKAMHGNELLGFTIVDEDVDPRHKYFENVLGATTPGIRGKMIAVPLYRFMLEGEKERFIKYTGRVSSSNAASINLHFQLGGSVKYIYDEFIYNK